MVAEFHLGDYIRDVSVQKEPFLAVVAVGKEVIILDLKEMTVRSRCIGHTDVVKKAWISADGKRVLSWSMDCTIRQWDIHSGREYTEKFVELDDEESDKDDEVLCTAFCSAKSFVATGSHKGRVELWDLCSGERMGCTMHTTKSVYCIEVSPNGRAIAVGVQTGGLLLWDLQVFTALGGELKGDAVISSIAFSPESRTVASAGCWGDLTIRLWDVENGRQGRDPFRYLKDDASSIAFSEDGQHIISGHLGGWITVWDVASGAAIRSWNAHSHWTVCVPGTGEDGSRCAVSGGGDGTVRVWDLEGAANMRDELIKHDGPVHAVAASSDGRVFVSASQDETLRTWSAADGAALGSALCGHKDEVLCVAMSPDSRWLVSGSQDRTVRTWNVATGAQIGCALREHTDLVRCVAYSGDGRFVVSGSGDCTARIWRAVGIPGVDEDTSEPKSNRVRRGEPDFHEPESSGEPLHIQMILMHELPNEEWNRVREVSCAAFSPCGQRLVSGLLNGEIWVWDITSRECIHRTLPDNGKPLGRIEISGKNEFVTMNKLCQQLRWRLDDKGGLTRVQANEDEIGVAGAELQEGSMSNRLNYIVCCAHTVLLSGSGVKIATLPDHVWPRAWMYDAQRRVLCAGLDDGRVLFFQVQC